MFDWRTDRHWLLTKSFLAPWESHTAIADTPESYATTIQPFHTTTIHPFYITTISPWEFHTSIANTFWTTRMGRYREKSMPFGNLILMMADTPWIWYNAFPTIIQSYHKKTSLFLHKLFPAILALMVSWIIWRCCQLGDIKKIFRRMKFALNDTVITVNIIISMANNAPYWTCVSAFSECVLQHHYDLAEYHHQHGHQQCPTPPTGWWTCVWAFSVCLLQRHYDYGEYHHQHGHQSAPPVDNSSCQRGWDLQTDWLGAT